MAQPFHIDRLWRRPLDRLDRLRSTYWFLPSSVTVAAVLLAFGNVAIDRSVSNSSFWLGWIFTGGPDGARALLSAVAGSVVTVVSVTFSVMVVALTVSSQHFGPRLLNSFMRDNAAQLVLGTFTGTFAYCLIVLRTVQGQGDGSGRFVPHLSVTVAVILTLISVGMLIYYVHHIALSLQVSEITAGIGRDLERAIERLYPERVGAGALPPARPLPEPPAGAVALEGGLSGYVQEIDSGKVLSLACRHETTLWITAKPGDFVVAGEPLAMAHPPPAQQESLARALRKAYLVDVDRTSRQDAAFAVQQLVEIALRALSPGVNEPFTAITCIDRLGQGLTSLAGRRIPSGARTDDEDAVRVVSPPRTFAELVTAAFEPILHHADRSFVVALRMLETLGRLALVARRPEDRDALTAIAGDVVMHVGGRLEDQRQRAQLQRLADHVKAARGAGQRSG